MKDATDCAHCQALEREIESLSGLMEWVTVGLSKTISRQEWKIEQLRKEVLELTGDESHEKLGREGTD